ncbi:MAG: ABC transporter ATP-binding protein [Acidobacteria bacterium]|nr:MAG: ABC transporter ATP-binding protein [Acidobacteriota bacterium]PIE91613.1 MAG: ABC transporter ATP-binding protein [Acidobacteriota bacterium]
MKKSNHLKVQGLNHRFGFTEILREINFELHPGSVLSIVGPSGSGKTTLLHLCAGLLDVEEGLVENGFQTTAFAFQEPRLLPWKTALDNIMLGLLARGEKKSKAAKRAAEMALKLGLEELDFTKFPKELSGGMKQRVSFARALLVQPQLLFLDEPFSALDIGLKQELQAHLIELIARDQVAVLFVTHDLMEAIRLSDEMIVLDADPGRIAKTFAFDMPREQREDEYVYHQTAQLMRDPTIVTTFELNAGTLS